MQPASPAPPACAHTVRTEGVCDACGDCEHALILNGACFYCGTTELDPIALSPKKPALILAAQLTRKR